MSKKVAILEGDKSRRFGGVKYLRTDLSGGGTCEWVPESERKLTTKTVKKNGTYKISDEKPDKNGQKYYGFSQFTVNVKNSTTGKKNPSTGGDGNEYSVKTNEDTGMLEETLLPSSIKIVGNPTKTEYGNGEAINKAGMVVKAYLADGSLYDYSGYQAGAIPLSELTIDPTTASGESSDETATSDLDLGDVSKPFPIANEYTYVTQQANTGSFSIADGKLTGMITNINPNGYYIIAASANPDAKVVEDDGFEFSMVYAAEYDNKKVYWLARGGRYWGGNDVVACSPNIYPSGASPAPNDVILGRIAWTMIYGDISGGGDSQTITVKWNRPEDEKELTDTFNITVN